MGPTGVNVVEATADNETLTGEPATFVATTTPAGGMDIVVRFVGTATAEQLLAFAEAEVRWESVITNDLSDAQAIADAGDCGDGSPAVNEPVDDLLILASVQPDRWAGQRARPGGAVPDPRRQRQRPDRYRGLPRDGSDVLRRGGSRQRRARADGAARDGSRAGIWRALGCSGAARRPGLSADHRGRPTFHRRASHHGVQCCRGNPV